jgi:hypothetical protein
MHSPAGADEQDCSLTIRYLFLVDTVAPNMPGCFRRLHNDPAVCPGQGGASSCSWLAGAILEPSATVDRWGPIEVWGTCPAPCHAGSGAPSSVCVAACDSINSYMGAHIPFAWHAVRRYLKDRASWPASV